MKKVIKLRMGEKTETLKVNDLYTHIQNTFPKLDTITIQYNNGEQEYGYFTLRQSKRDKGKSLSQTVLNHIDRELMRFIKKNPHRTQIVVDVMDSIPKENNWHDKVYKNQIHTSINITFVGGHFLPSRF